MKPRILINTALGFLAVLRFAVLFSLVVLLARGGCSSFTEPASARFASVTIHGEKVAVAAEVHTLGGFSAHAGQTDLLKWFSEIAPSKFRVILTHGEDGPRSALAKKIQQQFKLSSTLPDVGNVIEL